MVHKRNYELKPEDIHVPIRTRINVTDKNGRCLVHKYIHGHSVLENDAFHCIPDPKFTI